jgi:sodium-dependent multivitamin transporter 6
METLSKTPGLPGLFLACLFSAALSTISSGLNSLAAVCLEDILKSFVFTNNNQLCDRKEAKLSKLLCILFGILCLLFTYGVSYLGGLLQAALSLFGVIGGPILGLFCLGFFAPFANSKGAIAGTLTSLAITLWLFIGANVSQIKYEKKPFFSYGCDMSEDDVFNKNKFLYLSDFRHSTAKYSTVANAIKLNFTQTNEKQGLVWFYSISYTWYGLIAVLVTVSIGSLVSLLTGPVKKYQMDEKYSISLPKILLPRFILEKLKMQKVFL